jgi:hypothetical protein
MDSLCEYVISHILSYIPSSSVIWMKSISKRFNEIVFFYFKKNPLYILNRNVFDKFYEHFDVRRLIMDEPLADIENTPICTPHINFDNELVELSGYFNIKLLRSEILKNIHKHEKSAYFALFSERGLISFREGCKKFQIVLIFKDRGVGYTQINFRNTYNSDQITRLINSRISCYILDQNESISSYIKFYDEVSTNSRGDIKTTIYKGVIFSPIIVHISDVFLI